MTKEYLRKTLGLTKAYFYKGRQDVHMTADTYHITDRKERTTKISGIQRQSVLDFCHSDEGSSTDSNLHKVVTINNVDYAARV